MHEIHVVDGEMLKEIVSVKLEMNGQLQKTQTYTRGGGGGGRKKEKKKRKEYEEEG